MSADVREPVSSRRRQLNALLLVSALPMPALLRAEDAGPAGPPFRVMDFDWVDAARSRAVPARLYWPAQTSSAEGVPLVVFSHGIGGSRQGYSYLGRHWSSRGVASLHVQHAGSDVAVWRGNPFGIVGRLRSAAQESEAIARAADVRFALDRMLSDETGPLGRAVDRRRLVAAGHSYGANTTLLSIGAQVVRQGRVVTCQDERFSAGIVISAPPFYGESDLAAVLGHVSVPTVHITATEDVIEIPGYRSGAADRLQVFDAIGDPRKLLAVFQAGSHSIFTDRSLTGGAALNPKVKLATAELGLAFLDLVFKDDGAALAQWRTTWLPLLARAPAAGFPSRHAAMQTATHAALDAA